MKNLLISFIILTAFLASCRKDCSQNIATCSEIVPTNEECLAYFERWFYNHDKKKCEHKSYSGCSAKGFATKSECEECKCR